jgi:hypothetical protein
MISKFILLVLTLNAFILCGCTTVKPWERDILADYTMRSDRDPLENMLVEHMWFSREAASGGMSIGGGGCGCN